LGDEDPGRLRGITIPAAVLCGAGVVSAAHDESACQRIEASCQACMARIDPASLFDLIRDIREEAPYLVQYEDGPNRTYIEAQAVEAMIRIVPKIELPSDHH